MRPVHTDCRHYRGDRPCKPHKEQQCVCTGCAVYAPQATSVLCPGNEPAVFTQQPPDDVRRILIIKLAAVGDVVRTTTLLPALAARWPRAEITWLTGPGAVALFAHNPYVKRVLVPDAATMHILQQETFDVGLCLDLAADATGLACLAQCHTRYGFMRDAAGAVVPLGPAAETWYEMSLWDDVKKNNHRTYQDHIFAMTGLAYDHEKPVLILTDAERNAAGERLAKTPRPRVGLNLGGGTRWRYKRWELDRFAALAARLHQEHSATPVLFYGPAERELAAAVTRRAGVPVCDTGADNSLRLFAALIAGCDLLVTSDSLGMHLAQSQDVPTIVLFGPTSGPEIELYGRGEAIVADIPCQCCYRPDCDVRPTCMEAISVDTVAAACARLLRPSP